MDSHKNEEPAVVATIVMEDELAYHNGHVAGRLTAEERELNRRIEFARQERERDLNRREEFARQERERDRLAASRRPICAPICPCCWPCYLPCLCCCLPNLCI
jgi:hypothetical protein